MRGSVCALLAVTMLLAGCRAPVEPPVQTTEGTVPVGTVPVEVDGMFTDRDGRTDYTGGVLVLLEGDRVVCDDASVEISGTTVTLRGDGTYILRGTLEGGQIAVEAGQAHKPQLVLDGVSVTASVGPALVIRQADKVFVTLAEGTENRLTGGTVGEDDGEDGALFSRQDLTLNGTGGLTVVATEGHGIVCKDDLKITGGTYVVESAAHGVDANDSVRIKDGSLTVDAGKDGIHVEHSEDPEQGFFYLESGSLDIEAEGDGISASAWARMMDGTVEILAGGGHENGESHSSGGWGDFGGGPGGGPGGMRPPNRRSATEETGSSMKGMKAGTGLWIGGGTVTIDAADDGLHSDGSVEITGGELTISTGDDGIHGETELTVRGGVIRVTESYEGLEAKDIRILGGDISVVASDDGFNAAGGTDDSGNGGRDQMFGGGFGGHGGFGGASDGSIVVDDGTIHIQASGDGMDANGYLEINGGYTVVCGPDSGDTATLDYDTTGTINGGTFLGSGASGMAQTFSDSTQGVLAVSVGRGSEAGTEVLVTDREGRELVKFQPELPFSVVIVSTPELVKGQTYHIRAGTAEGDLEAY